MEKQRTMIRRLLFSLALTACLLAGADGPALDTLLGWLGGGSNALRVKARQLLPREGAAAAPALIKLLDHESAEVWWAAQRVLEDIANEASIPGREAERLFAAGQFMGLLDEGNSERLKKIGFRLLPLVVPEGFGLGPVAAYLNDPELREKARRCLQEIGTDEAVRVQCEALCTAGPAFQTALLHGLAMLPSERGLASALSLAQSHAPEVRAAAARVLSGSGDPAYGPAIAQLRAAATPETAFEAADALLRFADAMAVRGGNWDLAMGLYRGILVSDENAVHQAGAISGLGRFGDETVVDDILASLKGPNGAHLEGPAVQAFASLGGQCAAAKLVDAYASMPRGLQIDMLAAFGAKGDAAYLPLLEEAVRQDDPEFRHAAMRGLAVSELPGAEEGIAAYAEASSGAGRDEAVAALKRLAGTFGARNEKAAAGRAYLALFRLSDSEEARLHALEGIKQFPVEEAFPVVLEAIGGEEMDSLPVGLVAGLAKAMYASEREEDATRVLDALMPRLDSGEAVREAMHFLAGIEGQPFQRRLGFITEWWLAGPFPWSSTDGFQAPDVDPKNIDLSAKFPFDGGEIGWKQERTGDAAGLMPMTEYFGMADNVSAYAYVKIELAEAVKGAVRAGSDDGIRIWVNGEMVHANNIDRGCDIDQDVAPAQFRAGMNEVLIQSTQNGGGWAFLARLTKADGTALEYGVPTALSEKHNDGDRP